MGYLDAASAERVVRLLEELGFELFAPELLLPGKQRDLLVLEGVEEFREHLGGQLCLTLLRGIGHGFEVHELDVPCVRESIRELEQRRAGRRLTELLSVV
jgi:3-dehydroquinate synthase